MRTNSTNLTRLYKSFLVVTAIFTFTRLGLDFLMYYASGSILYIIQLHAASITNRHYKPGKKCRVRVRMETRSLLAWGFYASSFLGNLVNVTKQHVTHYVPSARLVCLVTSSWLNFSVQVCKEYVLTFLPSSTQAISAVLLLLLLIPTTFKI